MPGLFLINAWMLAGLVALSVPVIVHLLLRRKKKRLRFSTVQFFLKQDEQAAARRKLRNWLFLALRLLILALVVLAFARPYLRGGAGAADAQPRREALILLDRSLSMQSAVPDGSKWQSAKEAVRKILADLGPNDRAAVVGNSFQAEVLSTWAPPSVVGKLLAEVQPVCGASPLAEGLQQVVHLLSFRNPEAATTVYIVSDLQATACEQLAFHALPREVEVKPVQVGDLLTPNLAITGLRIETHGSSNPYATISSFSDEDVRDVLLETTLDGKVVSSQAFSLSAGASTNLELAIPPSKPGWHDIAVRLPVRDSLTADNERFATLLVPEPARVIVVEPRQSSRVFEQETFFVATALEPGKGDSNAIPSRFTVETVSVPGMLKMAGGGKGGLGCDVVILPALRQVTPALVDRLIRYARDGGGLLLFLGDGVSPTLYNADLQRLLPASIGALEQNQNFSTPWRIGPIDTNSQAFAPFQLPRSGDLSLAHFWKRSAVPPCDPELVLARFQDGTPLLLAAALGSGRIVLVNTSADTSWNDWPKHKTFVPWLHGMAGYLAGFTGQGKSHQDIRLAGTDHEIELGSNAAGQVFKITTPDGMETTLVAGKDGALRDVPLTAPGIYSFRNSADQEARRLAVNVASQESDLTALTPDDFHSKLERSSVPPNSELMAGLFGPNNDRKELWRALLFSVLALLLLEMFIANRTIA